MVIGSSIVAGNLAAPYPEIYQNASRVMSDGYNLIGDSGGDSTSTNVAVTYSGTDILDTDPQLTGLIYYVSKVPVHAPSSFPASPVIDKGRSFAQMTDQRGAARTYDHPSITNAVDGDGTDIGAVELQAALAATAYIAGKVTNAYGNPIMKATVTVQDMHGGVTRVLTNGFGFYRVSGLETGGMYMVSVEAKRHVFPNPTQLVSLSDNLAGLDFAAGAATVATKPLDPPVLQTRVNAATAAPVPPIAPPTRSRVLILNPDDDGDEVKDKDEDRRGSAKAAAKRSIY
jgi:hypothetical protein